jgi:hypothetical protein
MNREVVECHRMREEGYYHDPPLTQILKTIALVTV